VPTVELMSEAVGSLQVNVKGRESPAEETAESCERGKSCAYRSLK
jgi:hypothetical protein